MAEDRTLTKTNDLNSRQAALMNMPVSTPDKLEIDSQLVIMIKDVLLKGHILKGVISDAAGIDLSCHLKARLLFKWLSDPRRTADQFIYALGPMGKHVVETLDKSDRMDYKEYFVFVVKIAAEALAVHRPILEGTWEDAAWMIIGFTKTYCTRSHGPSYGHASDHLTEWIIQMISDPVLCPNPDLRTGLIVLFSKMVQMYGQNRTKAFHSLMSAFLVLNIDQNTKSKYRINLNDINNLFVALTKYRDVLDFDQKLCKDINDATSTGYTGLVELHGLTALLNCLTGLPQLDFKNYIEHSNNVDLTPLADIFFVLYKLVSNFKSSCQSYPLIEAVSVCILNFIEVKICIAYKVANWGITWLKFILDECEDLLKVFCPSNDPKSIVSSPMGQEIIKKNQRRLRNLRDKFGSLGEDVFQITFCLIFFD